MSTAISLAAIIVDDGESRDSPPSNEMKTPILSNNTTVNENTTTTTPFSFKPKDILNTILKKLSECTPGGSKWRHLLIIPAFVYLIVYALFPTIPTSEKYPINVSYLVTAESTLFGGYLPYKILNKMDNPFFDVLCAIPYTLHIPLPIMYLVIALIWQRSHVLPFIHCFGIASLSAVIIQFVFPTAPPWYYEKYGEEPASYDMHGDPAGLARVDQIFGTDFYHQMFEKSTIVFGAFPSLHVTWSTLICLFLCSFTNCCKDCAQGKFFKAPWRCPKWIPPLYVIWLCFAVVYLEHHYVVDVIGGLALAFLTKHLVCGPTWVLCGVTFMFTPRSIFEFCKAKTKKYSSRKNTQGHSPVLMDRYTYEEGRWEEEEDGATGGVMLHSTVVE